MANDNIDRLLRNKVSFLTDAGPEEDIAISSRIRLARNLADFPFPAAASPEQLDAIRELVAPAVAESSALGDDFLRFDPDQLTPLECEILFERRLVSRDTLMTKLWETDDYIEENTLTVNIARLRKKLDKAGLTDFITTKVGEGYLIPQAQDPVKTDA